MKLEIGTELYYSRTCQNGDKTFWIDQLINKRCVIVENISTTEIFVEMLDKCDHVPKGHKYFYRINEFYDFLYRGAFRLCNNCPKYLLRNSQ